jgi:cytochrome c
MTMQTPFARLAALAALCGAALAGGHAHAVDASAANALARQNNCFKCHGVDKAKDGPPFKQTADRYRGKPDAAERLFRHLTTGPKARFADGHEEEHKIIRAAEADTRNLVSWILGL